VQPNQLELWCAEPHVTPRLYPQLNPEQRTRLIHHLAFLMLKRVRNPTPGEAPATPRKTYER